MAVGPVALPSIFENCADDASSCRIGLVLILLLGLDSTEAQILPIKELVLVKSENKANHYKSRAFSQLITFNGTL